jgi:hypothetical protein
MKLTEAASSDYMPNFGSPGFPVINTQIWPSSRRRLKNPNFFINESKIFIHHRYLAQTGELPPENQYAFAVENVDAACK